MYYNVWSKYEALARILGISKKEIACLCGSSDKITVQLSEKQISQRAVRAFDKIMAQFDPDTQEKIFKLRDALMTTNYKSITAKKRFTPLGNFLIAMGYTHTSFAEIMKVNEGMISKAVNNTQDKSDELYEKIKSWLTARYSVLSAKEQEKVDLLRAALDIIGNVKANPYRKRLTEIGALNPLPKPVTPTNEVSELKEYIKLLEEENETLREKNAHINPDYISKLEKENEALRVENHAMNDEIMDLNRELETRNTANDGLQDGVHNLNQKIDELEAEIFRLEEEKDYLLKLKAPATSLEAVEDYAPNMVFNNCTVNIYNCSRENSGT